LRENVDSEPRVTLARLGNLDSRLEAFVINLVSRDPRLNGALDFALGDTTAKGDAEFFVKNSYLVDVADWGSLSDLYGALQHTYGSFLVQIGGEVALMLFNHPTKGCLVYAGTDTNPRLWFDPRRVTHQEFCNMIAKLRKGGIYGGGPY